ncbi:MAG: hypothetical protein WBA45_16010 [Microthrixaceae bacterium]
MLPHVRSVVTSDRPSEKVGAVITNTAALWESPVGLSQSTAESLSATQAISIWSRDASISLLTS